MMIDEKSLTFEYHEWSTISGTDKYIITIEWNDNNIDHNNKKETRISNMLSNFQNIHQKKASCQCNNRFLRDKKRPALSQNLAWYNSSQQESLNLDMK
jgi:hypothetical protein